MEFSETFTTDVYLGCYAVGIFLNKRPYQQIIVNLEPSTKICWNVDFIDGLHFALRRQSKEELYQLKDCLSVHEKGNLQRRY